jgi:hypothetical protein
MAVIDPPSKEEKMKMFYNRQDNKMFRQILVCEKALCGKIVRRKIMNGELLLEDDMTSCVGLESCVSRSTANYIAQKKHDHIRSVLEEYNRQVRLGYYNADELARVSSATSLELKVRSHKIALGVMHLGR